MLFEVTHNYCYSHGTLIDMMLQWFWNRFNLKLHIAVWPYSARIYLLHFTSVFADIRRSQFPHVSPLKTSMIPDLKQSHLQWNTWVRFHIHPCWRLKRDLNVVLEVVEPWLSIFMSLKKLSNTESLGSVTVTSCVLHSVFFTCMWMKRVCHVYVNEELCNM